MVRYYLKAGVKVILKIKNLLRQKFHELDKSPHKTRIMICGSKRKLSKLINGNTLGDN